MFRRLRAILLVSCVASSAIAADEKVQALAPKQIGLRSAVIEFSLDENARNTSAKVVSTEALALSEFAEVLIKAEKITPTSPGVTKLSDNRYRLTITFPVKNDAVLPAGITRPVPRVRQAPVYPFDLRKAGVSGGVLLRLTIDAKGNIKKVENVGASHPEFVAPAIQAVEKWVLKPAMKDGVPTAITILQLMTFEIVGKPHAPLEWRISPEPALSVFSVQAG